MLEKYEKAANNDLQYIRNLIRANPAVIDEPCPVDNTNILLNSAVMLGKTSVKGALSLAALAALPGAWPVIMGGFLYNHIQDIIDENRANQSRLNWTMLTYAAATGATEVAVYLIMNGANTKNKDFLILAEKHGHLKLVELCKAAIQAKNESDAKILKLENDNIELKIRNTIKENKISFLNLKLIKKSEKYQRLQRDFDTLLDLGEEEPLSIEDMHAKIKSMNAILMDVYQMCHSQNHQISDYASKLYPTLYDAYQLSAEEYRIACDFVKTTPSENHPISVPNSFFPKEKKQIPKLSDADNALIDEAIQAHYNSFKR